MQIPQSDMLSTGGWGIFIQIRLLLTGSSDLYR